MPVKCNSLTHKGTSRALNAVSFALIDWRQPAAIAVVDLYGELLAFMRTACCPLSASTIAMNKAFTSAREGRSTRQFGRELRKAAVCRA